MPSRELLNADIRTNVIVLAPARTVKSTAVVILSFEERSDENPAETGRGLISVLRFVWNGAASYKKESPKWINHKGLCDELRPCPQLITESSAVTGPCPKTCAVR